MTGAKEPKVLFNIDADTPVSIQGEVVRADWYYAGEGLYGDYNPEDPDDIQLLRFDVYTRSKDGDEWRPVDDASYCTYVPLNEDRAVLVWKLREIYNEYNDVLSCDREISVKKMGEVLSWI